MIKELCGFHTHSRPELFREEILPTFLAERSSMGEDVALPMEESPGSFLPMLNMPGRTRSTSLFEVTAYSWTLGDE